MGRRGLRLISSFSALALLSLTMCAAFATKSWHIYLGKCPRGRDGDQTNVLELLVCFYSPQAPHLLPREYSAS
jgi:hypothetical protein